MLNRNGFTLIEMMVVLSIIGILSAVGIPAYQDYIARAQAAEAILLADVLRKEVDDFYQHTGRMPIDNDELAIPSQQGRYVAETRISDGVIHIRFRQNNINAGLSNHVVSAQPMIQTDNPTGSLIWRCGKASPDGISSSKSRSLAEPPGFQALGSNQTNLDSRYLPTSCRG